MTQPLYEPKSMLHLRWLLQRFRNGGKIVFMTWETDPEEFQRRFSAQERSPK